MEKTGGGKMQKAALLKADCKTLATWALASPSFINEQSPMMLFQGGDVLQIKPFPALIRLFGESPSKGFMLSLLNHPVSHSKLEWSEIIDFGGLFDGNFIIAV